MSALQQITVQIPVQAFGCHAETGDEEEGTDYIQVSIPEIVFTPEEMEQIGDPEVLLTNPFQLENLLEEHDALSLFKHHRCISLTLNILATWDVSKVPRWSSGSKDPFNANAQALWNGQNIKIKRIKKELGTKL